MFTIIWQFDVRHGSEAEFERHYAADGTWVSLFRNSPAFVETRLLRDIANPLRYITIDVWHSAEEYFSFRTAERERYDEIDRICESLTVRETKLAEGVAE